MTFVQLMYFVALSRELNFTRAADACYTSQPNLSRQIAALEKELKTTLVVRSHGSVRLTEAGKIFAEFSRSSLKSYHHVLDAIRELDSPRELRFGCINGIDVLDNSFSEWSSRQKNITVQAVFSAPELPSEENGLDISMVIADGPLPPFSASLYQYRLSLLVPESIAGEVDVSEMRDLQRFDLLVLTPYRKMIEHQLVQQGLDWKIKSYDSLFNFDMYLATAQSGGFIALKVNDHLGRWKDRFIEVDFPEVRLEMCVCLVWREELDGLCRGITRDLKDTIALVERRQKSII